MEKGFDCLKCGRAGFTKRGLILHESRMHPDVPRSPQPKPKVTIINAESDWALIDLNLANADHLDVGDVIWHVRKLVIKQITKTEGSNSVSVLCELTKKHWQARQPI